MSTYNTPVHTVWWGILFPLLFVSLPWYLFLYLFTWLESARHTGRFV